MQNENYEDRGYRVNGEYANENEYSYNNNGGYGSGLPGKKDKKNKNGYYNGMITGFLIASAVFLFFAVIFNYQIKKFGDISSKAGNVENIDEVSEKIKYIQRFLEKYYYEDIDTEQLAEGLYYGMVASVGDVYTSYYTAEEYETLQKSNNGEYCGIGVVVRQDAETGKIAVNEVYSKSPAMEAGIEVGDVITSVNGESIDGMSTSDLVSMIGGKEDTKFSMTVDRNGKELEFDLTRRKIEVDTVLYEMKEDNIGYVRIKEFDSVTASQVESAIKDLKSQGMESIIIDLRDNPGGMLTSVREIASMFLPEDKLFLYSETKDGEKEEYYTNETPILPDMPMCILVNGESASASEALSGAMQCYDRAEIVGTTTFGKGIMQSVFPLKDGSALKITIGKYYLPDGSNIHKIGITPDYEVENDESGETDPQLDKAMELLK